MNLIKRSLISGTFIILFSCVGNRPVRNDQIYYDEFYSVLNDLIRMSLPHVSAIRYETVPVIKPPWLPSSDSPNSVSPQEPLPFGTISYNWLSFFSLAKNRKLDSLDVEFMYHSIDSSKVIVIDSNKICIPVITKSEFTSIFQDSGIYIGYSRIKKKFGTSCYISVSTPIFNSDYSKIVLSINYYCGALWGKGYEFVLEKEHGKWRVIDKSTTWES
jgi:hypothetical protein